MRSTCSVCGGHVAAFEYNLDRGEYVCSYCQPIMYSESLSALISNTNQWFNQALTEARVTLAVRELRRRFTHAFDACWRE